MSRISCCCCCCVASVVSNSVRPHRRQPTRFPRPWDSPGKNTGVGCHFLLQRMKVKRESEVVQLCPTLSDPMDCSPPGSPVPRILQAITLEWLAISFSNAWKWKGKVKSLSRVQPLAWTVPYQAPPSMGFPGKSTGVGCHCLLCIIGKNDLNQVRLTPTLPEVWGSKRWR